MLRLGIVDFDSSHSIEFVRRFNHAGVDARQHVHGARVVAGCPGSSDMSPERVPLHTRQIEACGVDLCEDPRDMIGQIDAVLVLSLCGAVHRERVRPFLEAGIPAYVDKPFACCVDDAKDMIQRARDSGVTLFNSSAIRFADDVIEFQQQHERFRPVNGAITWGPAKRAEGNPGLFHYGIHATEMLFALMGAGCERVQTTFTDAAEVVTGQWPAGPNAAANRIGTIRGNRSGSTAYGFTAFCEHGVITRSVSTVNCYRNLCREIVRTFGSGTPSVPVEESLEVVQFVCASLESEQSNGQPVSLA